jgi:hypothetical protein
MQILFGKLEKNKVNYEQSGFWSQTSMVIIIWGIRFSRNNVRVRQFQDRACSVEVNKVNSEQSGFSSQSNMLMITLAIRFSRNNARVRHVQDQAYSVEVNLDPNPKASVHEDPFWIFWSFKPTLITLKTNHYKKEKCPIIKQGHLIDLP